MKMPGFTAEASVYKTLGHYSVSGTRSDLAGSRGVKQAAGYDFVEQRTSWGNWWHCWYVGGCVICCSPYWCWWYCYGSVSQ
jgi:hypothetical protein